MQGFSIGSTSGEALGGAMQPVAESSAMVWRLLMAR